MQKEIRSKKIIDNYYAKMLYDDMRSNYFFIFIQGENNVLMEDGVWQNKKLANQVWLGFIKECYRWINEEVANKI